mmetsp:Transcript_31736/g.103139  ORF Transcript_31736/g.103139 Transcript_31736/m.103139 type:complete len:257 (+) Transcript_31736:244-1014(+)
MASFLLLFRMAFFLFFCWPGVAALLGPEEQARGRHAVERDERVARTVEAHVEVGFEADRAAVDEVRRAVAPRAADAYPDVQTLEGRGDGLRRRVAQDERVDAAPREPRSQLRDDAERVPQVPALAPHLDEGHLGGGVRGQVGVDQVAEAHVDDDAELAVGRAAVDQGVAVDGRVGLGDRAPPPRGVVRRRERVEAEPLVERRRDEALEVVPEQRVARGPAPAFCTLRLPHALVRLFLPSARRFCRAILLAAYSFAT